MSKPSKRIGAPDWNSLFVDGAAIRRMARRLIDTWYSSESGGVLIGTLEEAQEIVRDLLHAAAPNQTTDAWRQVSAGSPVHIRPLVGGGIEVALYARRGVPLDIGLHRESDRVPEDQVRRVAAYLAAIDQ